MILLFFYNMKGNKKMYFPPLRKNFYRAGQNSVLPEKRENSLETVKMHFWTCTSKRCLVAIKIYRLVVAQLVAWLILTQVDPGSNPVINKFIQLKLI